MMDGNYKSHTAINTRPITITAMFNLALILSTKHLQILVCLPAICVKLCAHS